jgi:hypothetical protein
VYVVGDDAKRHEPLAFGNRQSAISQKHKANAGGELNHHQTLPPLSQNLFAENRKLKTENCLLTADCFTVVFPAASRAIRAGARRWSAAAIRRK